MTVDDGWKAYDVSFHEPDGPSQYPLAGEGLDAGGTADGLAATADEWVDRHVWDGSIVVGLAMPEDDVVALALDDATGTGVGV
jgi:hypothetical protein